MKKIFSPFIVFILLLSLAFSGCTTTAKESKISRLVPVSRLNFDQITTYVGEQKGNPLLVNFWATWCEPCVEELPDLIKLYNTHQQQGLAMVGFSVDFPEQTDSVVKPFVKSHHIPYPIYVADPDDQDKMINHFSKNWSGAVPCTFLYDSTGRLVRMRMGKMSYSEMEEFLKPVFKKKNPKLSSHLNWYSVHLETKYDNKSFPVRIVGYFVRVFQC